MSQTPLFEIGSIVYLRESAARGFLESVRVSEIRKFDSSDTWAYGIVFSPAQPVGVASLGDAVTHKSNKLVYYAEDEFVLICDALVIIREYLQTEMTRVDGLIASYGCDSGST